MINMLYTFDMQISWWTYLSVSRIWYNLNEKIEIKQSKQLMNTFHDKIYNSESK